MQVIMINISQTANNLSRAFQKFEGSTEKLLHEEFEFARTFKYISFGTKYMLNGTRVANFRIALSIVFSVFFLSLIQLIRNSFQYEALFTKLDCRCFQPKKICLY